MRTPSMLSEGEYDDMAVIIITAGVLLPTPCC